MQLFTRLFKTSYQHTKKQQKPVGKDSVMPLTTIEQVRRNLIANVYDMIKFIVQVGLIVLVMRVLILQPFQIPSGSMIPNLLIGDYLMVSKFSYGYGKYSFPFSPFDFSKRILSFDEPARGDIAVFRKPSNPSIDYIKRIIGLPGDTVQVIEGRVHINGFQLPRERVGDFMLESGQYSPDIPTLQYKEWFSIKQDPHLVIEKQSDFGYRDNTLAYTVPVGHYFMMGDNRDASQDSRVMTEVGFVPEENLIGRAEFLFFSVVPWHRWWKLWDLPDGVRWSRIGNAIQ